MDDRRERYRVEILLSVHQLAREGVVWPTEAQVREMARLRDSEVTREGVDEREVAEGLDHLTKRGVLVRRSKGGPPSADVFGIAADSVTGR